MPSAVPQAWSHGCRARLSRLASLVCALGLGACSVYTEELLEADDNGDGGYGATGNLGGSLGSGGKTSSAGKSTSGGKPSSGMAGSGTTDGGGGSEGGTAGEGSGAAAGTAANQSGSSSGGESSGSGGSGSIAGSGGGGGGTPPVTGRGDLIDGFEDEDLTLEQTAGRGGVWYLFDDGTTGKVGPAPLVCTPLTQAPAGLGGFAMHITASGFTVWGSGLGVDFRAGKKVYDGSKHTGVRFWARVGEGKNTRHRLQLADGTTDKLGGKCNPALDALEGEKCEDHFGINQTFTTTWTEYVVPFTALTQIGWGNSAPTLDKSTLYSLQFTAKAKLDVDLWLDQIEFF